MKTIKMLLAVICCAISIIASATNSSTSNSSNNKKKLAGIPLEKYTIVWSAESEDEEGKEIADYLMEKTGCTMPTFAAPANSDITTVKGKHIHIINSSETKLWEYKITFSKNSLIIDGGGNWAMLKAADIVTEAICKSSIKQGYRVTGSVEGEQLFQMGKESDLRILVDNIWDYSKDTIPPAWKNMATDCRDFVRAPQFAQMVRAYMPDVLNLQEYSAHMDAEFLPLIEKYGYVHTTTGTACDWNNTPILYNKNTVKMIDSEFVLFTPKKWSNHGSKSYSWAVFERLSDKKQFAIINTHLWWKSEKAQPGSNQARAAQIRLIIAEAQCIKAKYPKIPVFVTGDMNSEEGTMAIQQFFEAGFTPCYKVATEYANLGNGHHICSPGEGYSRKSKRKSSERSKGAIDHAFIWNQGQCEIKVFDCITTWFTVPLTDHYPYIIDSRL